MMGEWSRCENYNNEGGVGPAIHDEQLRYCSLDARTSCATDQVKQQAQQILGLWTNDPDRSRFGKDSTAQGCF